MLQAIVFDFDGVIANSEPLHLRAFQAVLAEEGVALADADYYAQYLGFDDGGTFRRIAENRGRHWPADTIAHLIARKAVRFEALEHDTSILFPGAADAIRRASDAVPIAIASGARGDEIRRVLAREGLTSCFRAIVSADDCGESKPSPEPYLHALAQLSAAVLHPLAAHECVAIEDSLWGLASARAAGLKTVAVAQTYAAAELHDADLVIGCIAALDLSALDTICSI